MDKVEAIKKDITLKKILEFSSEAIIITDLDGKIVEVNNTFTEITGYSSQDILDRKVADVFSKEVERDIGERIEDIYEEVLKNGEWTGETADRKKNGTLYQMRLSISSIKEADGSPFCYLIIFSDITTLRKTEESIQDLINYDRLTSLPNRMLFIDRLKGALNIADFWVGVAFLDIDEFKVINDSLGHWVGDLLLQETALRIGSCLRGNDTIARVGGDEFAIIMPNILHGNDIGFMVEKILEELSKPFMVNDKEIFISASIGVAVYPDDAKSAEELIRHADTAMYHVKKSGKSNFKFFSEDMNESVRKRLETETALRKAIDRNEFMLYYQPQVDSKTNEIIGMEALIRWNHPNLGIIYPNHFIPLAEETGLIIQIGEWVIKEVCGQIKSWEEQGIKLVTITVNISGKQLGNYDLPKFMEQVIKETNIDPVYIALEITESEIMKDFEKVNYIFEKLRQMGIKIAIDDFGTGYSSLSYLGKFSINTLKIDKSFVKHVAENSNDAAIIKAIISLAKSLNLDIITEGVETKEQLMFLQENGCDTIQGFYFSKPVPTEKIVKMLTHQ